MKTKTGAEEYGALSVYSIGNKNYFMLRELGGILEFNVSWDQEKKEISLTPTGERDASVGKTVAHSQTKEATPVVQKIVMGEENRDLIGYTIDGYTYFSVRDVAALMNHSCTWDAKNRKIMLEEKEEVATYKGLTMPENMDALVKEYTADWMNSPHIIQENNVVYITNSREYENVTTYIQKNIDSKFYAGGYNIYEHTPIKDTTKDVPVVSGEEQPFVAPYSVLQMRYVVAGHLSNYGYNVTIIEGFAKIVNVVGQWNDDFSAPNVKPFPYTDEELKQMAIKEDGLSAEYRVEDVEIRKFFDMNTLEIKAEVEIYYESETKYPLRKAHIF